MISGYLITSILVDGLDEDRFSIAKFYERRARRILPALFFVLIVTTVAGWVWMIPTEFEEYSRTLAAVVLFASNIYFWRVDDYFAPAAQVTPLSRWLVLAGRRGHSACAGTHRLHTDPHGTGRAGASRVDPADTETFLEDVAQVIRFEELQGVILVGHSFAGSIVSGLADRMPERLRHLVYLDAMILQSGQSQLDTAPAGLIETYEQRAKASSGGLTVMPNPPEHYGITDRKKACEMARQPRYPPSAPDLLRQAQP